MSEGKPTETENLIGARLRMDLEDYVVIDSSTVTPNMDVRSFGDAVSAAHFLRDQVFADLANRHTMESILMDQLGAVDISRLDEHERIQRLVDMLMTGRLVFVKVRQAPLASGKIRRGNTE